MNGARRAFGLFAAAWVAVASMGWPAAGQSRPQVAPRQERQERQEAPSRPAGALLARKLPARVCVPRVSEEAAYWWARAIGVKSRNRAPALLVSRAQFARLRPFRSWQDLGALRDYVQWADRPEAAGFTGDELVADVSGNDLILLRVPALAVKASVPVKSDPLGYAVLDPGRTGLVRIRVALSPAKQPVPDLPDDLPPASVPLITAAVRASPSLVTIYGEALAGKHVKVFTRKGPAEVLYAGANQINAKVRSIDEVAVEVDGLRSDWAEVQQ